MKLKKCVFSSLMLLLFCACFVLNSSSGFAVSRYVEVHDDYSYEYNTYATGIIDSDSGFISCEPLKAKYINQKYESSSKEVYYKLFRIQGETEINYEIIGTKHKSGKSSSLTTGSFLRTTDLELSHRRYAYGITYDGSSTNLVLVGSASIVIERNYPEVFLNSEVNELYPEDMERDDTEIDCTRQDNQDTEDEPEQEVNPVDVGASE